jgi:Fe-S cluster assembly protein SufB
MTVARGEIVSQDYRYAFHDDVTYLAATNLIVQCFLEIFTKELPMEYAIEFNRLVKMEMEGPLG